MFSHLRQWIYPKEFRVTEVGVPLKSVDLNEEIKRLEDIIKRVMDYKQIDIGFIREMATYIWRLEKRIASMAGPDKPTRLINAVDMMKDLLTKENIEIKDYTGMKWGPPYDEMYWDAVNGSSSQKGGPIRMATPRILYNGEIIQLGKLTILERQEEVGNEQ